MLTHLPHPSVFPEYGEGRWVECCSSVYSIMVHGPFGQHLSVDSSRTDDFIVSTTWAVTDTYVPVVAACSLRHEDVSKFWQWVTPAARGFTMCLANDGSPHVQCHRALGHDGDCEWGAG